MTVIHPKPGPKGQKVIIHKPSTPSAAPTWQDAEAVATFIPEGVSPSMLNGIAVAPITTPRREMDWAGRARSRNFNEPDFEPPSGLKPAAGAVVVEPDGRVWIVHPTNAFGGYQATFPKGTVGKGGGLRATALREVFEESALLVELLDFLTDSKRSMSFTRYYVARRIGGSPVEMGWESQAVSLVPFEHLTRHLNHAVDHAIVDALLDRKQAWTHTWWPEAKRFMEGHLAATKLSWKTLPMPDRHTPLALDFTLNAGQAQRMQQGFIPVAMEQHWFSYFEHDTLFLHRSWTGYLIYRVSFVPDGTGLRATSAVVNRDREQYGNTDDEHDRRLLASLIIELSEAPPNEELKDPIAEGFAQALGSDNYLGSPGVVTGLLDEYVNTIIGSWLYRMKKSANKVGYDDVMAVNLRLSRIFSGDNPDYSVIGPWNTAEQLGQAVIRQFNLDADYLAGENLLCILSEGFAALHIKADEVLRMHFQEGLLNWAEGVVPRLQNLFKFAGTVLLGTHTVFYPGKTFHDFGMADDV